MSNFHPGKLIVITGKTTAGKDTIISRILAHYPNFKKVITTTSRKIRAGEVNGVDYYFVTEGEFKQKINTGDFVEYVEYGGNLYGTEKRQLMQNSNQDLIWKIDPSRAGKIRQLIKKDLVVIYINTSDDVILQRLRKRGLSEEEIKKRMLDDKKIWDQYKGSFDYVVENVPGKLEETIKQISTVIDTKGETLRA